METKRNLSLVVFPNAVRGQNWDLWVLWGVFAFEDSEMGFLLVVVNNHQLNCGKGKGKWCKGHFARTPWLSLLSLVSICSGVPVLCGGHPAQNLSERSGWRHQDLSWPMWTLPGAAGIACLDSEETCPSETWGFLVLPSSLSRLCCTAGGSVTFFPVLNLTQTGEPYSVWIWNWFHTPIKQVATLGWQEGYLELRRKSRTIKDPQAFVSREIFTMLTFCGKQKSMATTQECAVRSTEGWSPRQMFYYFWHLEVLIY